MVAFVLVCVYVYLCNLRAGDEDHLLFCDAILCTSFDRPLIPGGVEDEYSGVEGIINI